MSWPKLPNYTSYEWNFPSRDRDPSTKKDAYCMGWAKAVYSLWCRNRTAWGATAQDEFSEMRLYSRGEQDITQYQKWLLGEISTESNGTVTDFDDIPLTRVAKREGWYNILWENLSPCPMIFDAIHGMFDKADYDLYVDTIDADSRKLAEEQKFVKFIEAKNLEWQNKIKMEMGIPIDEDVPMPKSKEELDMFEARDGFKLNVAKSMQKILRHSFNISEWDTSVLKKLIDDFGCIEYAATEDYYDSEDSKWKCRYLDPSDLVIQYSREHDYSTSEYAGYFMRVTISNLRSKLPNLKEEELYKLAQTNAGKYGNPEGHWEDRYSKLDPSTETYRYDGFNVPVFHAWWIDTDVDKKLYYKSFRGRESIISLGWDTEVKPLTEANKKAGATQSVKKIAKRQPYEAYWLLDTDYVYDFGPIKMASRKRLSKPQLPVHVEQLLQPSLMRRMKPIVDQMTQTFLRHQNSLAMMVERGYAVNTTMLGNVTMGGGKLKPAEVMKLWQQTGRLLYSYSASTGLYTGGAALPVTEIPGGMGERVKETMETFNMLFTLLEKMTGLNAVAFGGSPDPNAPVGTTQAALQATTNVLKPIMEGCYELKKGTGECMMRRIQIGIKNDESTRTAYAGVISPSDMEALRLMEYEHVQYGMSLKAKPDMQMKARFVEWCNIALQNVREQRPGVDLPDVMYFETALNRGEDMYELINQMRYIIEKNKQEAQAQAEKNMQVQGEINAQNEQVKAQAEQARIQAEGQAKISEEIVRGKVKANQTKLEGNLALLEATRLAMEAEQGITVNQGGR